MFTGIIQAVGSIANIENKDGDIALSINTAGLDLSDCAPGDSIAVNGVCLTAVAFNAGQFVADVSVETLDKTSLGGLTTGSQVNLEKALTLSTALGGHLVSGHVDGLATLVAMQQDARSTRYSFELAPELQHYIAIKGSVTIDGTSLTVNNVNQNRFDVNIVPHTQLNTIFGYYRTGTQVNIEVDIIARYLERLISGRASSNSSDEQLMATLTNVGFIQSS
ncbi:MAG: riboflavin synthase [Gammaproteobacteria bacterium]|jgi:riboflavin synthase